MDHQGHVLVDGLPPPDGTLIEKVLEHVVAVAELHAVLTSPRRQHLRRRLLQSFRPRFQAIHGVDGSAATSIRP